MRPALQRRIVAAALCLGVALAAACGGGGDADAPAGQTNGSAKPPGFGDGPIVDRVIANFVDLLPTCDVEHRGAFVDLGTEMTRGRAFAKGDHANELRATEREGATWTVVEDRSLEVWFTLREPHPVFVEARVDPGIARSVGMFIDDQPIGSARLKGEGPRIVGTGATERPFDAGEHVLLLRFSAPAKQQAPVADVDWVRLGFPDELKTTFGPPTLDDLRRDDAVIGSVPHRAITMRLPGSVRCPIRVPRDGRLRLAIGRQGTGPAEADIIARVEGEPDVKLLHQVMTGEDTVWHDVEAKLDSFAGKLVEIELRATSDKPNGRVLFGDPELVVPSVEPSSVKPAQVVVVLDLAGIDRDDLPGYAARPAPQLERFTKLASTATVFERHRAPSSVVPANFATLLTGLPPRVHTVTDYGTALPASLHTLMSRARDAAVQTAIFTAVPHSFKPFGFTRGVSNFVSISPVSGEGRDVVKEAATWLTETLTRAPESRVLLVIHARGAHPPWALQQKVYDTLPPENYTGDVQPRRAAQQLASLRRKKAKDDLSDQDQVRLGALYQLALADQDRSLGALQDALSSANVEDKTLLIVTADLSNGLSTLFADDPPFSEAPLTLPLYVSFPGTAHQGGHVVVPTQVEDVTRTITQSLGIEGSAKSWGRDLSKLASGIPLASEQPQVALFGDAHTVRLDWMVLRERTGGRASLCNLELDPLCTFDRRPTNPFISSVLLRAAAAYEARVEGSLTTPVALELDDETLAALQVWGSM
ncbi:MAG: sulfatase-like hydrolase/transferase [Polyangiaceae bacterium]